MNSIIIKSTFILYFISIFFAGNNSLHAERNLGGDPVLSQEEKEGLIWMREEEKLAYDVYSSLYEKWQINAFYNIAQSERRHTESIKALLDLYGLDDPYLEGKGIYSNEKMTELYKELTEKGNESIEDALRVGAKIEDLDIADLDKLSAETQNEDIQIVYNNLIRASRNHLRTFNDLLLQHNVEYTPQFISQDRYDEIISGSSNRGKQKQLGNNSNKNGKRLKGLSKRQSDKNHNKTRAKKMSCKKDCSQPKKQKAKCNR